MVERDFEEEFENARKLIGRLRFTLGLVGLWPLDPTYILSSIWIIYLGLFISLELVDLYTVLGNFELMITNFMESSYTFMVFVDDEEKMIFLRYINSVIMFHKISTIFAVFSTIIYYFNPAIGFLVSYLSSTNQTISLRLPARINFYHKSDTNLQNGIVYFLMTPLIFAGLYRPTIISLLMMLVFTACSQLAILSRKVQQCRPKESDDQVFSEIVENHREIISMSHSIDKVFSYLLLFELTIVTVLLGLTAYTVILNLDNADKLFLANMIIFYLTNIIGIFGNCLFGQYLITESTNLHMSFAKCLWYEMPMTHRKSLLICMSYSAQPLYLTAGKFYTFSLSGYTSILKTSMAYVSMLRSVADQQ